MQRRGVQRAGARQHACTPSPFIPSSHSTCLRPAQKFWRCSMQRGGGARGGLTILPTLSPPSHRVRGKCSRPCGTAAGRPHFPLHCPHPSTLPPWQMHRPLPPRPPCTRTCTARSFAWPLCTAQIVLTARQRRQRQRQRRALLQHPPLLWCVWGRTCARCTLQVAAVRREGGAAPLRTPSPPHSALPQRSSMWRMPWRGRLSCTGPPGACAAAHPYSSSRQRQWGGRARRLKTTGRWQPWALQRPPHFWRA